MKTVGEARSGPDFWDKDLYADAIWWNGHRLDSR